MIKKQERETFEAWMTGFDHEPDMDVDEDGYYEDFSVQRCWVAWQARAIIEHDRAQRQTEPAIEFSDPQVQIAYAILADSNATPPAGEHWEGFAARRIVSALRQAVQQLIWCGCGDGYPPESFEAGVMSVTGQCSNCNMAAPQPAQMQLTPQQIETTIENWFAEDWAIEKARGMLWDLGVGRTDSKR